MRNSKFEEFCLATSQEGKVDLDSIIMKYSGTSNNAALNGNLEGESIYPNLIHLTETVFLNKKKFFSLCYPGKTSKLFFVLSKEEEDKMRHVFSNERKRALSSITTITVAALYQMSDSLNDAPSSDKVSEEEILTELSPDMLNNFLRDLLVWMHGNEKLSLIEVSQFLESSSVDQRIREDFRKILEIFSKQSFTDRPPVQIESLPESLQERLKVYSKLLEISVTDLMAVNFCIESISCNTVISPPFGTIRNLEMVPDLKKILWHLQCIEHGDNFSCLSFIGAIGAHSCTRSDGFSICMNSDANSSKSNKINSDKPLATGSILLRQAIFDIPLNCDDIGVLKNYLTQFQVPEPFFWAVCIAKKYYLLHITLQEPYCSVVEIKNDFWIQGNYARDFEVMLKNNRHLLTECKFEMAECLEFLMKTTLFNSQLLTSIQYGPKLEVFSDAEEAIQMRVNRNAQL